MFWGLSLSILRYFSLTLALSLREREQHLLRERVGVMATSKREIITFYQTLVSFVESYIRLCALWVNHPPMLA